MAASTREDSSGSSIPDRFSVERALELLGLIDGDNSDLDMSDNDDPILDGNYQPSPQEESSSENEGDSSDDEDPIPEPTDHSKGRKCLRGAGSWTGTETGTGTGSSRTLRRPHQTQEIEADSSEDDLEEPTPRPSQTKNKKKGDSEQGRGICWKATPLTPNLAEYQHQDKTDLDRHGWTPLHYFEQMYWSKALKITAITDKFTRARFFKLRGAIKVVVDHDVPEDLRMSDKFWKESARADNICQ
ncbi:hypothetical protein AALO_G00257000 [Alosa alosa]|uniref:PiggyBac transposable element-derived protein domain-containing protein n=1 Tax=Alosa alosa TaxID=278164 RepID=A0AAV6FTZ9_9TELE|nr:hypothetical protein AALO_G00257000 [Alosa alosa]